MEALEIRLAEPAELESVVELWARSRWDAEPALEKRMGYTREQNREHFANVIARENSVWLALRGGRIVGLLAYREEYVDQLFVEPGEQRTGVGRALLKKAKQLSPRQLALHAHQTNTRARAFYESQGFQATGFGTSPPPECEPDVTYVWKPIT
jgi:GNAT superfamily N-acetyltransferase